MIYHYLHGSVKEFYQDVPFSAPIPREWKEIIPQNTETLLRFGQDNSPHHHSMLLLSGEGQSRLLRACCAEQRNSKASTYYVHKQMMDITTRDLLDRFDELLTTGFLTEEQFDDASVGLTPCQPGYHWTGPKELLSIPDAVLRAVLYGMTDRWRIASDPVVIEVPADVDYDSYTYQAVRTIYAYLPAAIRAHAGFMTYTNPDKRLKKVTLFFVPEGAGYPNAIRLDGSSGNIGQLLNCRLPDVTKAMLDRIIDLRNEGLRTGDHSEYAKYLLRLEEDLESVTSLRSIKHSSYVTYLTQSKLLDIKPDCTENFQNWLAFAKEYDPQTAQPLQKRLLCAMRSYLTNEVLDSYVFADAKQADCLASFKEKIAVLDDVFRCSETATAYAKEKTREFFNNRLKLAAELNTLESVQSLKKEIEGAKETEGSYPDNEMLRDYEKACDELWSKISRSLLEQYLRTCKDKIDSAFKTKEDLHELQDTYKGILQELENDTKPNLLKLDAAERKKHIQSAKDYVQQRLYDHLKQKAQIDPALQDPITTQQKTDEDARLLAVESFVRRCEMDFKTRQEIQEILRISRKRLENRYYQTPSYQKDKLTKAVREENYFAKLQKLTEVMSETNKLSEADVKNTLKQIRMARPNSISDYCAAYEKQYHSPLSICALADVGEDLRRYIAEDLRSFGTTSVEVQLGGMDMFSLIAKLQNLQALYLCYAGVRRVTFELRYEERFTDGKGRLYVEKYDGENLLGTLRCILGKRSEYIQWSLPDSMLRQLFEQLTISGTLVEEQIPRAVNGLFASRYMDIANELVRKYLLSEQHQMKEHNRQILILVCRQHGQINYLLKELESNPSLSWLKDEIERLCGDTDTVPEKEHTPKNKRTGKPSGVGKMLLLVTILLVTAAISFMLGKKLAGKPFEDPNGTTQIPTQTTVAQDPWEDERMDPEAMIPDSDTENQEDENSFFPQPWNFSEGVSENSGDNGGVQSDSGQDSGADSAPESEQKSGSDWADING